MPISSKRQMSVDHKAASAGLLKDLVQYSVALFRHWSLRITGLLLALVGIANLLFGGKDIADKTTGEVTHRPLISSRAVVGLLLLYLVAAGFSAWRQMKAQHDALVTDLEALSKMPAPAGHIGDLRSTAESLSAGVKQRKLFDVADIPVQALRAHLPDLVSPMDTWLGALDEVHSCAAAFESFAIGQFREAGLDSPPFHDGTGIRNVKSTIKELTLEYARSGRRTPPPAWPLKFKVESKPNDELLGGGYQIISRTGTSGTVLAAGIADQKSAQSHANRAAAVLPTVALAPETVALTEAEAARDEAGMRLTSALDGVAHRYDFLAVNPGCPLCPEAPDLRTASPQTGT